MARTKIKRRTYNLGYSQHTENISREAERVLTEHPVQEVMTQPSDVTETEEEDLPSAFLDWPTVKGQGDAFCSKLKDVCDRGNTHTIWPKLQENAFKMSHEPHEHGLDVSPKQQENGLEMSPKPQKNGLDMSPKPQKNGLDMSPKPQKNGLDTSPKPHEGGLDMPPKPHENGLYMSPKQQENGLDMSPGPRENGADMNDESIESVSRILGGSQGNISISQDESSSNLIGIDTHISRDSPLNLALDSSIKENCQLQSYVPDFRPVTPDFIRIPVDEILSPTTRKEISTTIRALFPNGYPPPPPPVRPMRRPKKRDLPYIVDCTKRPRVPSPTSLSVFQGDNYGITNNTNYTEEEDQCSPVKRRRRGPNGCGNLSKSRFNPKSNEIAERLKLYEKIDRQLGRTPKEQPVNYMSKPRSFSPLPSTSTDNETIMKNDKYFSESLNCDNFDIDDDEELPEIFWGTSNHKQEEERKYSPLVIDKDLNEDKKSYTDNILSEINDDMNNNNNNDIIHIDDDLCEINFDKYMPKEKILYYSDEEIVEPKHEPMDKDLNEDKKSHTDNVMTEINDDMNNNNNNDIIHIDDDFCEIDFDKYMPKEKILYYSDEEIVKPKHEPEQIVTRVLGPTAPTDVICVDDVYNTNEDVNPVSQASANTGTSVLRASNKIAPSTDTKQSDQVIEVPDVLEPINMTCQAPTSLLPVCNEVQFVSEYRTNRRLQRDENSENISDVQFISQTPANSRSSFWLSPDFTVQLHIDMSDYLARRKMLNRSKKNSKKQKSKQNPETKIVNNENTAPHVNQAQNNGGSQPASTTPGSVKGFGECPICLENLSTGSIASTNCGHVFCLECIKQSMKSSGKKCPTCRKQLRGAGYHQVFL